MTVPVQLPSPDLEATLDDLDAADVEFGKSLHGLIGSFAFDALWLGIAWAFLSHASRWEWNPGILLVGSILVGPAAWASYKLKRLFFTTRRRLDELRTEADRLLDESGPPSPGAGAGRASDD